MKIVEVDNEYMIRHVYIHYVEEGKNNGANNFIKNNEGLFLLF